MEWDSDRNDNHRGRMVALMVIASLVVFGGFLAFARWSTVLANTPDINSVHTRYPGMVGTRIDSCSLCHTSSIPNLNPYGMAYRSSGRTPAALAAIESLDSDGDGYTNLQEITALTFPGDPGDHPAAATPTSPPPTATRVQPTATQVLPTATRVQPTATQVLPTATSVQPTATQAQPTATQVQPTATQIPATATEVSPTSTRVGPTPTGVRPTPTRRVEPTRTARPTKTAEPRRPTRTPEPTQTKNPRPSPTLGCWNEDDGHSGEGGKDGKGRRPSPTPTMACTPISPEQPEQSPRKPKEHSGLDHFAAVAAGGLDGYLDVPLF